MNAVIDDLDTDGVPDGDLDCLIGGHVGPLPVVLEVRGHVLDEDAQGADIGPEALVVDAGDDGVDDLVLEGVEGERVVLDVERHQPRALLHDAVPDLLDVMYTDDEAPPPVALPLHLLMQLPEQRRPQLRAAMPRVKVHRVLQRGQKEHLAPCSFLGKTGSFIFKTNEKIEWVVDWTKNLSLPSRSFVFGRK